jgi:cell division protein FtsL
MNRERTETLSLPIAKHSTREHASMWGRPTVIVIAIATLIAALCFLYVWQGTALLELTAHKESLKASLASAQEVNRYLEFQIDQAFSLERVSRIARQQLGMVEPSDIRYVPVPPPAKSER